MSSLKVIQDQRGDLDRPKIKAILAVAAGKGGVGKSTVAVNLALSLRKKGLRVGLLDADIYGPSLEQMLPEGMEPAEDPENPQVLLPGLTFGMPFISVAHFKKEASIVRAPVANQIIDQFLNSVKWGELDYLIIDFPPGTGDIQLTLMQKAKISAALVVTTPQVVATLDVRKAIQLFQKMQIPILGVIENMSRFFDPASGSHFTPFGSGGGEALAKEFGVPLLGEIPIDSQISEAGDSGKSLFDLAPEGEGARVFEELGHKVDQMAQSLNEEELEVRQQGATHLEVRHEGKWVSLPLSLIQQHCPCARCEKGKKSVENVSLLEFSSIGRYAIRITFSSGCSQGIYPISLLRELAKS